MSDEPRAGDDTGEGALPGRDGETAPWERPRRWDSEPLEPTKVDDLLARLGNPDLPSRSRRRAADDGAESVPAADLIAALQTPGEGETADSSDPVPGHSTADDAAGADQPESSAHDPAQRSPDEAPADHDAPTVQIPALPAGSAADDPTVLLTQGPAGHAENEPPVRESAPDGETQVIPRIPREHDDADSIRAWLAGAAAPAAAAGGGPDGPRLDHRNRRRVMIGGRAFATLLAIFLLIYVGWNWRIVANANKAIGNNSVQALDTGNPSVSQPSTKVSVLTTTNSAGQTTLTTRTSPTPTYAAENILMIGSDTRADGNGNASNDNGQEQSAQSDTLMLAHISADRQRVTVLSIPRDTIIPAPSCKSWDYITGKYSDQNFPVSAGQKFHINNSYSVGGPKCVVKAVESLTGIGINRFIGIDFNGFKDMVDALHGVTLNICRPIDDAELGWITRKSGVQTFQGQQALNLVRARNVISDNGLSDLARIKRQQEVLSAILRQLSQGNVLLNPTMLNNFLQAFTKSTFTDNVDINSLAQLASSLGDLTPGKVTFYTMPTVSDPDISGAVDPEPKVAAAVFAAINNDDPLPGQSSTPTTKKTSAAKTTGASATTDSTATTATTAEPAASTATTAPDLTLTVAPKNVDLQVYNVTGQAGVATTAQKSLNALGFKVTDDKLVRPANQTQSTVEVLFSAGNRAAALTVAAAVPGAVLKESDGLGSAVRLMLGSDFSGQVTAVSIGAAAPASVDGSGTVAGSSGASAATAGHSASSGSSTTKATPATTLNPTQVTSVNAGTAGCV